MDQITLHAKIGEALTVTGDALEPFIAKTITARVGTSEVPWAAILQKLDQERGRGMGAYSVHDPSLQLRALTEKLGPLGFPFDNVLPRIGKAYASELRQVRNLWAHNELFTPQSAFRAIDTALQLVDLIGAAEASAKLSALKDQVLPVRPLGSPAEDAPAPAPESATLGGAQPTTGAEPTAGAEPQAVDADGAVPAMLNQRTPSRPAATARVDISAKQFLSYAMAHARVGVIDEIVVENLGDEARAATVEVDVVSASGSLGGPKVLLADLAESPEREPRTTTLRDVELVLDPVRMLAIDTLQRGQIRVTVRNASGVVLAEAAHDVQILAHNQWIARPTQLGLELLAVHVQPNATVIDELIRQASDRLKAATGSGSLDSYQSGSPERVDAIVAAIYDAARACDIRYAEPPAGWGISGQKVRTPDEVLSGGLGTCLDTTVVLAAALEQVGINPTLWIADRHAFLGYWRVDASLGETATTTVDDVVNRVELGQLGVLETTMVTGGDESAAFEVARRAPVPSFIDVGGDRLIGVVDIRQARESGIYPLPSRTVDADGNVSVTTYTPAQRPAILPYQYDGVSHGADAVTVPPRVAQWKNSLLDLSLRNKLINYTDRAGFSLAVPSTAIARFEDQINAGVTITLLPSDRVQEIDRARGIRYARDLHEDARAQQLAEKREAHIDLSEATYTSRLRYLAYKAKTIVEETGANNLYLAFGMLRWRAGDRDVRSPLVLVPVTLKNPSRNSWYKLVIDEAGQSTPNYCLIERLRTEHNLEVPELMNPSEDASGIDLAATFTAVRTAILNGGLPFHVDETVDLAILQFAKFRLWKDLNDNWQTLAGNPLVNHLIETPTQLFTDPVSPGEEVDFDDLGSELPVPADSSQVEAVASAVAGNTFVLEGPPGTGKSQTITNLLAHALAKGKRVLFVAEKRAALNVVKQRLETAGLGAFSLDLHDKGARPAAVRAQIKTALNLRVQSDAERLTANREVERSSARALARYAERLHETNPAGYSLYGARTAVLASDVNVPALNIPTTFVATTSDEDVQRLRSVLRELPVTADLARPSAMHPWGFVDSVPDSADALLDNACRFDFALDSALAAGLDLAMLERVALGTSGDGAGGFDAWTTLVDAPRFPLESMDAIGSPQWQAYVTGAIGSLERLKASIPEWSSRVRPEVLDRDLAAVNAAALEADASGMFGRKKRRRAVLARFADLLLIDPKTLDLKTLSSLTGAMLVTQQAVREVATSLQQLPLAGTPVPFNPYLHDQAEAVLARLRWLAWLTQTLCPPVSSATSGMPAPADLVRTDLRSYYASTPAGALGNEVRALADAYRAVSPVLLTPVAQSWSNNAPLHAWRTTGAGRTLTDSTQVKRWIDFVAALEPLRAAGLASAREALLRGVVPADDAVLAFDTGLAAASVIERGEATGLVDFVPESHLKTIDRFTTSSAAIRDELPNEIPAHVLANRSFSTDALHGRIGLLRRQLDRQRGGMSVRKLLDEFGDLITQLMPCTLMSPESVARFFPARQGIFDLVVFDEASQIRVADAIGAMGRAASVVVVGDSRQMPPTSFAEASGGVDDDDEQAPEVVADEESILSECAKAGVPSKWLSWHYRSQDESLILFSNQHYYENRLSSFPAPLHEKATTTVDGHGVSLVRVNGVFERTGRGKLLRTNPVEADAIVADVRHRFAASPDATPSLGVITFNAPQRDHVENLLRDSGDERIVKALDEPDGLFVKNLENVQGDERDCILFSVAFSANERGVVPLNFGPLSRAGGERRLNVAITRARRQVVLYSSFDPDALRTGETSSIGLKHLREYLELAQRGADSVAGDGGRRASIDRHRDEIANELRLRGFAVATDVGLSEFRVDISLALGDEPSRPLVAVLLDGPAWRSRRTVADRDGLPREVLQGIMRWPGVQRVWLPEWLSSRDAVLDRLTDAVANAATAPVMHSPSSASKCNVGMDAFEGWRKKADRAVECNGEAPTDLAVPEARERTMVDRIAVDLAKRGGDFSPLADSSTEAVASVIASSPTASASMTPDYYAGNRLVVEFAAWIPSPVGTVDVLDELPRAHASTRVQLAIRDAVATEGPVHPDRLVRLIAAAFGLSRVNDARVKSILRCAPAELRPADGEGFLWPTDVIPAEWQIVRRVSAIEQRPIDQVSLIEIANALRVAAETSGGMDDTSLKREALGFFGGRRLTESIGARLDAAVRFALESGRLERLPNRVLVGAPR